jgi:hypothetical protein
MTGSGIMPDQETQGQRVRRPQRAAAPSAGPSPELGDARQETRGRPADDGGLSREEIAKRIGDDAFQDNPDLLTRRKMGHTQIGRFTVPKHLMKPGWDYEFKVRRVMGEGVSPTDVGHERNQGWRPVPASDVREMLPPDYNSPVVEYDGQILMMRPLRLSREARNEMIDVAEGQRREKLQQAMQAPPGRDSRIKNWTDKDNMIEGQVGTWRPSSDRQQ